MTVGVASGVSSLRRCRPARRETGADGTDPSDIRNGAGVQIGDANTQINYGDQSAAGSTVDPA